MVYCVYDEYVVSMWRVACGSGAGVRQQGGSGGQERPAPRRTPRRVPDDVSVEWQIGKMNGEERRGVGGGR